MNSLVANCIQVRIRVFIPQQFRGEPILSCLTSRHAITFNIVKASLQSDADGQFDLDLMGTTEQIRRGLDYLQTMGLTIVSRPNPEGGNWHQ